MITSSTRAASIPALLTVSFRTSAPISCVGTSRRAPRYRPIGVLAALTIVIIVTHTAPWIALNAGLARSEERFIDLVDNGYWGGLIDWIQEHMLGQGYIAKKDLDLFTIVDDPEDIVDAAMSEATE